jgi:hypothetical protein
MALQRESVGKQERGGRNASAVKDCWIIEQLNAVQVVIASGWKKNRSIFRVSGLVRATFNTRPAQPLTRESTRGR